MEKEEQNIRTFNVAKKFAEDVLHPIMLDYKRHQRQADFGSANLDDAVLISEEIRDIQRVNGLKAMAETTANLLEGISSTVISNKNREEVNKLKELKETIKKVKSIFYENKQRFFFSSYRGNNIVEAINRDFFLRVREIIESCYINTEILMTRNDLLFSDKKDEFKSDQDIKKEIMEEYVNG